MALHKTLFETHFFTRALTLEMIFLVLALGLSTVGIRAFRNIFEILRPNYDSSVAYSPSGSIEAVVDSNVY